MHEVHRLVILVYAPACFSVAVYGLRADQCVRAVEVGSDRVCTTAGELYVAGARTDG